MTSRIRLRYSGLTVFSSRLFQILTGLLFTIAVTRNLTPYEFGIWQNIGDLQGYFTILAAALPGWQIRYLARGQKEAGKTGVVLNLVLSIPFAAAFLALSPLFAKTFTTSAVYYALASIQVVELFLIPAAEGLSHATRPHVIGYVQFLREIVKILFGVLLIVVLKLGILGAIFAVAVTYAFDIIFILYIFQDLLRERLRLELVKDWAKGSLFSLYGIFGGKLASLDTLLLILIVGVEARALYGAAFIIGALITYANSLSIGLYPRLLAGGGRQDVETALKTTYLFAVPMAAGTIVYAESFLTILNPAYSSARLVLILFSINSLLTCFSVILDSVIYALEGVDREGGFTLRELLRSSFFVLPTVGYVLSGAYLTILYFLFSSVKSFLAGAQTLIIVCNVFAVVGVAVRYWISRKRLQFKIPSVLLKYALSALIMSSILYFLPSPTRIITTFLSVIFGAVIYFVVLAAIDYETRATIHLVLRELHVRAVSRDKLKL